MNVFQVLPYAGKRGRRSPSPGSSPSGLAARGGKQRCSIGPRAREGRAPEVEIPKRSGTGSGNKRGLSVSFRRRRKEVYKVLAKSSVRTLLGGGESRAKFTPLVLLKSGCLSRTKRRGTGKSLLGGGKPRAGKGTQAD